MSFVTSAVADREAAGRRELDYLALGHVTADVDPDGVVSPGGAVYYAAAVASGLGLRTGVVTTCAENFPLSDCFPEIRYHSVPADATTTFANRYDAQGNRTQQLLDIAPDLEPEHVPAAWGNVGVLHVAPVVHEVDAQLVDLFDADFVGLTPQGFMRTVDVGQLVRAIPWSVPVGLLDRVDAVVLSEEDLAGDAERLPWLAGRVPIVVVTRGWQGAHAYVDGSSVFQPAVEAQAEHPTGAGDSFAAALFALLWEGADVSSALRFAAAAAAFAIEEPGPVQLPPRQTVARRGDRGA